MIQRIKNLLAWSKIKPQEVGNILHQQANVSKGILEIAANKQATIIDLEAKDPFDDTAE